MVTGKKALQQFFVKSSLSGAPMLEEVAIKSALGNYCLPIEAKACVWIGKKFHPDDLRICHWTGLPIHFEFASSNGNYQLRPLSELLEGLKRTEEGTEFWKEIRHKLQETIGKGKCRIHSALFSPDKQHLAVCADVSTWLGLRTRKMGFLYSVNDLSLIGKIVEGQH